MELLGPRIIEVLYARDRGFYIDSALPALLHVNQEWRHHGLERYAKVTFDNSNLIILDNRPLDLLAAMHHKPKPNTHGIIVPFNTYIDYKRDTFYLSLGGLYHDKLICQQIMYSFLASVLQNPVSGTLSSSNPLSPKLERVVLNMQLLISTTTSLHHMTRFLLALPGLEHISLVISDEGIPSHCRDHKSSIHPCPRRAILRLEQSKDTKRAVAWNSTTGKVEGSEAIEVVFPGDPSSWEEVFEGELARHRKHFQLFHPGMEAELWGRLGFEMVNVVREVVGCVEEVDEEVVEEIQEVLEQDEDEEADTSSVSNPYEYDDEDFDPDEFDDDSDDTEI